MSIASTRAHHTDLDMVNVYRNTNRKNNIDSIGKPLVPLAANQTAIDSDDVLHMRWEMMLPMETANICFWNCDPGAMQQHSGLLLDIVTHLTLSVFVKIRNTFSIIVIIIFTKSIFDFFFHLHHKRISTLFYRLQLVQLFECNIKATYFNYKPEISSFLSNKVKITFSLLLNESSLKKRVRYRSVFFSFSIFFSIK